MSTYNEREQVAEIVANPDGFRDWLAKGGDIERVVGRRGESMTCPFATYLKEGPELAYPDVDAEGVRWIAADNGPSAFVASPAWLNAFIVTVDMPRTLGGDISSVTAREALEILDRTCGG